MVKNLTSQLKKLEKFNKDRLTWIRLSVLVLCSIFLLIIDWTVLRTLNLHWIFVSAGLIMSVVWWYWTMKLIRELIDQKITEVELLYDLIADIKGIKQDVKNLKDNS